MLGDLIELTGAFLLLGITIYLIYMTVAWSWGFLLWALGVAIVGLILYSISQLAEQARTKCMKRGEKNTARYFGFAVLDHAGRSLAIAASAIAVGLVATAIFQGMVLSHNDSVSAKDVQLFEESMLAVKLWLDRSLGLEVLAGALILVTMLSIVLPLKSLVGRIRSVRGALSFVYVVVLTFTSFTFFAGMALRPFELSLRDQLHHKAVVAFKDQDLDERKFLVAIAWILTELEDPATPSFSPDLVERLEKYLQHPPGGGALARAAWQVAGFEAVLHVSESYDRLEERHRHEVDVLVQEQIAQEDFNSSSLEFLRTIVTRIFGDRLSWLRAGGDSTQAWHYLRILIEVTPPSTSPLAQARTAGLELLSSALADKIGSAITGELNRYFVGELVQAVVMPLWDVILPLHVRDVPSARVFIAKHRLHRAGLDWSKIGTLPPWPNQPLSEPASGTSTNGFSTGMGSTSLDAVPMSKMPSWQSFGGPTAFVFRPPGGTQQVYTGVGVRFR